MQSFPCPFCGPRPEVEFHFAVEAGHARPEPAEHVSDAAWSAYLYENAVLDGAAREIWVHLTCGEFFVLERNTRTRAVQAATALPGAAP